MNDEKKVAINNVLVNPIRRWVNCKESTPTETGIIAVLIGGIVYLAKVIDGEERQCTALVRKSDQEPVIEYDAECHQWLLPVHWKKPTHWVQLYEQ